MESRDDDDDDNTPCKYTAQSFSHNIRMEFGSDRCSTRVSTEHGG
jgi:hypothetical protein